jgi:hypothetical protein
MACSKDTFCSQLLAAFAAEFKEGWVKDWKKLANKHLTQKFDYRKISSSFAYVVESDEHLNLLTDLREMQFEINVNFSRKFMWETASKTELQAVLAWIAISDNKIKSSDSYLIKALIAIEICIAKIDDSL